MDLTQITQLLLQRIGLDHGTIGEKSIELGVQDRMRTLGLSELDGYVERVSNDSCELQALTEELVVPETWFFRGFEQLRYMAEVASKWQFASSPQPLRVLSIPCSTGEEPYSIHMFLRHHGLTREQIQIDAVDISQRALDRAARGQYPNLSFRETHPLCEVLRQRFFEDGATNTVVAEVRDAVRFRRDNLVDPMFLADAGVFDLIFCRNILIYFDQSARQLVLSALQRLLARNGYVFGGHAEPLAMFDNRFKSVGPPGAFAYQRSIDVAANYEQKSDTARMRGESPRILPAQPAFRSAFAQIVSPPASTSTSSLSQPVNVARSASQAAGSHDAAGQSGPMPVLRDLFAKAEAAANSGRLTEASRLCEQHFEKHGPTAPTCCLMGILQQAAGELAAAEKSFQKALYLDPAHRDALWHLSLLAEQRGDQRAVETFKRRLARVTSGD